uniref:Uncharacterized protein n=1 Tax=Anguilla anguilla TaxID=7936 RepID=A0A0E9QGD2_ANGAN
MSMVISPPSPPPQKIERSVFLFPFL